MSQNEIPLQVFGTPREFEIIEIKTNPDKSWNWNLKIKFDDVFDEFFPSYNMHFILSPQRYIKKIEEFQKKLDSYQLSMDETEEDIKKQMLDTRVSYKIASESFGRHDFENIRLKEYKADNPDNTDIITFIVGPKFIEFYLKNAHTIGDLALVLNSSADEQYPLED